MDAEAKLDALLHRYIDIALGHPLLHFDRTADRIDDTGEFDEEPVASSFDDPPAVLFDLGITQLAADRLQRGKRAFLVRAHQPGIARDVGCEDRREAPLDPLSAQGSLPEAGNPPGSELALAQGGVQVPLGLSLPRSRGVKLLDHSRPLRRTGAGPPGGRRSATPGRAPAGTRRDQATSYRIVIR